MYFIHTIEKILLLIPNHAALTSFHSILFKNRNKYIHLDFSWLQLFCVKPTQSFPFHYILKKTYFSEHHDNS